MKIKSLRLWPWPEAILVEDFNTNSHLVKSSLQINLLAQMRHRKAFQELLITHLAEENAIQRNR